ncbi:MAG: hypothetical protein ABH881_01480 [bacterium]
MVSEQINFSENQETPPSAWEKFFKGGREALKKRIEDLAQDEKIKKDFGIGTPKFTKIVLDIHPKKELEEITILHREVCEILYEIDRERRERGDLPVLPEKEKNASKSIFSKREKEGMMRDAKGRGTYHEVRQVDE